jgi:hypothetical protein
MGVVAGSLSGLEIDRVYIPENCDIKSRNGDMMSMHYVCFIVVWLGLG